jgi:hypothetical protein
VTHWIGIGVFATFRSGTKVEDQFVMKISKLSALIGCAIVAVEAAMSLTLWVSDDPQYLAEAFWSDVVPQTALASVILLLPALALFFAGPFRGFVEKSSFLYPLLLLGQFWLISTTLDGLATPLIFLFFVTPIAVFLAVLIFIIGISDSAAKSA